MNNNSRIKKTGRMGLALLLGVQISSIKAAVGVDRSKRCIIAYGGGSYTGSQLELIADKFDLVLGSYWLNTKASQLKTLNPDIILLNYYDMIFMQTYYDNWNLVNQNELWFVHDQFGHRLKNDGWCCYLMDPVSGWKDHLAGRLRTNLDNYPLIDGIFGDDTWATLRPRWYVNIENEADIVNVGGVTVTTEYPIWNGEAGDRGPVTPECLTEIGVSGVWDNSDHTGTNYYTGGSFSGSTITLGTPLALSASVYVKYSAKDTALIQPPQDKIDSWRSGIMQQLSLIKSNMDVNELLVINTEDRETEYLGIVDGKMMEGFLSTTGTNDNVYPRESAWVTKLQNHKEATQTSRIVLACSGTKGDSNDEQLIKKRAMFCFCSYLMVYDPVYSYFGFSIGNYRSLPFYEEWDTPIGEPIGAYYLVDEGIDGPGVPSENLLQNPSFEDGLTGWNTLSWLGSVTSELADSVYKEGIKSTKVTAASGANTGGIYQYVTLEPNTAYTLNGWIKTQNLQSTSNFAARLYINPGQGGASGDRTAGISAGTNDWKQVNTVIITNDNTSGAYVYAGQIMDANGTAWFDATKLEEGAKYIVYARTFTNGKVLVNPGYGTTTLQLDKPYLTLEGQLVTTLTIEGHQGVILLNGHDTSPAKPKGLTIK